MKTLPPFILETISRLLSEDDMPPEEYVTLASLCLPELIAEINRLRAMRGEEPLEIERLHSAR